MPSFQINDAEWNALVEEPGDIFLAYCSIRRFMDYATGIAGVRRRLSEQMIREVLYVAPTRGRHESGSPTRQRVRSVIDRLVKLQVLVPVGPMVFELPLATSDIASKSSATDEQPDQQPYQQPSDSHAESSIYGACSNIAEGSVTASESCEALNSNLPPISDLPSTTQRAHESSELTSQRFSMHDHWQPSQQGWMATVKRNGISPDLLTPESLGEFRSYWINRPDKHQSQGQWEHSLAQNIKRTHVRSNAHDRQQESTTARQQRDSNRPRSAVDRVKQAIADREAREVAAGIAGQALDENDGDVRPPLDGECWRDC